MSVIAEILNGSLPASVLARELGLKEDFFSNVRSESLVGDIKVYRFKHTVLVRLNKEVYEILKTHTAVAIKNGEDESCFDYVLEITKRTKVGFWK